MIEPDVSAKRPRARLIMRWGNCGATVRQPAIERFDMLGTSALDRGCQLIMKVVCQLCWRELDAVAGMVGML